jgi:hypothetical protein
MNFELPKKTTNEELSEHKADIIAKVCKIYPDIRLDHADPAMAEHFVISKSDGDHYLPIRSKIPQNEGKTSIGVLERIAQLKDESAGSST